MPELKTLNAVALQILMTENLYAITEKDSSVEEVNPVEQKKPAEENTQISFNYLGENNKYLVIALEDTENDTISAVNLQMLTSMLQAKQLEIRDVAIVNLTKQKGDFKDIKKFFVCSKMVLFGINPQQIGLQEIPGNQITAYDNVKVLCTFGLTEMQNDVNKKRLFWNEMKKF